MKDKNILTVKNVTDRHMDFLKATAKRFGTNLSAVVKGLIEAEIERREKK